MKKQFITDDNGKKISVIIPIKEYEEMLEDLDDIRLYDEAKTANESAIPLEEYTKQRNINR
jgi:hypothetical protein